MEISLNVQIICEIINIVVILSCLSHEYDIFFHIQIFFMKNNFIKIKLIKKFTHLKYQIYSIFDLSPLLNIA